MKTNKNAGRKRKNSAPGKAKTSRREENKERTKQRILQAALHLFRTKGVEPTTAKEISTRAQIAEGTFFNYFPTKDDLALYFFQKGTDDLIVWFRANAALQSAPLREKLFAIIYRQLEQISPYEEFIGSVFFRSLQPRSKLHPLGLESQEHRLKYVRFINEVLHEASKRNEIPVVGDLGAYAFGLFYIGIVTFWLHDTSRGKQKTIAFLDRSLEVINGFLNKGGWDWV
jgi:AcrR family transcriptional regulator